MYEMFKFNKYGLYCIPGIVALLGSIVGTLAWFIHYIASLANIPNQPQAISPIELAGVTATLGGLALIGAFYRGKDESQTTAEREHTIALKLVGKTILLSAVCFIITYFLLEYARIMTPSNTNPFVYWFIIFSTDIAAIIAGLSLSFALGSLVTIVRSL